MPKTIRNKFDENLSYINLYYAHMRAKRNKSNRKDVILFEMNLENNLINLRNKLKNETYEIGKYSSFKIYEPKEREIKSLPYVDRIVHQWYVGEFILPYIVPKFIANTYACIRKRGTHKAVNKAQELLIKSSKEYVDGYILKCDIKKFFENIDKDILYDIIKNKYLIKRY